MDKNIIYSFVDQGLSLLEELDMMTAPIEDVPQEMVDPAKETVDDETHWKAVESTVTEKDLIELEALAERKLPDSYKEFLKYKHFFELATHNTMEVVFFPHPIRDWKEEFRKFYSYPWVKEYLLNRGFIPFATHQDWGIICFDANRNINSCEYPIIMVDHDLVNESPMPYEEFGDSFIEMLKQKMDEGENYC